MVDLSKRRKFREIREELEKEISDCSKCKYWKNKSDCYFYGDKPCSKHKKDFIQVEGELEESLGYEVRIMAEDSKIRVIRQSY